MIIYGTAEYYQSHADRTAAMTIELLADVREPARQYAFEHPQFAPDRIADDCFTIGYLTATIESLLDAMGYPKQGPKIDQRSWLPDPDDDDVDDDLNNQGEHE